MGTGRVALETWRRPEKKAGEGFPCLKIMIAVIVLFMPGIACLMQNGYKKRTNNRDLFRLTRVCFLEQDPAFGGQPEHDLA
jgi:hypothetical protein